MKNHFKNPMIVLLMWLAQSSFGQVQTINDVSKQIIPPSPTAASLGKYGDLPVNYHTGGVTISVPLYDVQIGGLSVPLALSYQTSGIKVTDVASRVGLGWTLQGEGVITRTVRGLPDEHAQGWATWLGANVHYTEVNNVTSQVDVQAMEFAAKGLIDCEPDMYNYNFSGYTGKFYVDQTGVIIKVPHNKLKITGSVTGGFTITDEQGTVFTFNRSEGTQINNSVSESVSYISSWYLTKILTLKNEEINITYEGTSAPVTYGFILSETDYYSFNGGAKLPTRSVSNQNIGGSRIQKIETRIEKVEFVYDATQREDLAGDNRLNSIKVFSKISNSYHKQIDFSYVYSSATDGCSVPNFTFASQDYKRLKLMLVTEHPYGASEPKKVHSFVYNPTLLPARCSFNQDHWGYYNNKGNSTMLPRISFFPQTYPYGVRDCNPLTVGAESLTEIHYPTGGFTKFDYGVHGYVGQVQRDTLLNAGASISNANIGIYQQTNFTVNLSQQANIHINYNYQVYDGTGAEVTLLKNGSVVYNRPLSAVDQVNDGGYIMTPGINLESGSYTLRVSNFGDTDGVTISAGISYFNRNLVTRTNYLGGLRVNSISDYTSAGVLAKRRKFTYENILNMNPADEANYIHEYTEITHPEGCLAAGQSFSYFVRSISNNFTMGLSQGSHVAYGKVNVVTEGASNGKTVYEYTTDADLGSGNFFPFPPTTSREHRRGLLKREAHFDQSNNLVKETINNYQFTPIDSMGAFKIGLHTDDVCKDDWNQAVPTTANMSVGVYRMVGEWIKHVSTTESSYPGPVSTVTNMFYDNPSHLQVTRKESSRSDGKLSLEYLLYPDDYADNSGFIKTLKDANAKRVVIEQVTGVSDANGSNKKITGGKINEYYHTTYPAYLKNIHFLETASPIALSSFKFSNRATGVLPYQGTMTTYAAYSSYTPNVTYDAYDVYGNVVQFKTNQGIPIYVKWGLQSSRPILLMQGVQANEFFYQNFEEHVSATAGEGHGGSKYFTSSFATSFTRPNTKNYYLTYYKLNGSSWQLTRALMESDSPTVNPGVAFDDVFIYPEYADFKLFNYDPKTLQLSDMTDNTHTIQYFSYEALQRLESIKDYNKDIVSMFNYHFRSN